MARTANKQVKGSLPIAMNECLNKNRKQNGVNNHKDQFFNSFNCHSRTFLGKVAQTKSKN